VKRRDVRELLDLYQVTGVQREQLLQLPRQSCQRVW
jgi:hypothetical protein